MKKIIAICAAILMTANVWAQSPEKMSYQAVVRDASNALITSQSVGMQISILQGSTTGTPVYVETQTPTSNTNGLVSLEIGAGNLVSGDFTTINWANNTYFIKTETDPTGGTSYTITGTSQLMSVPYALHSKTAESITGSVNYTETDPVFGSSIAIGITATDTANWNNHAIDTQLDETAVDGFVANNGYLTSFTEVDGSVTNEIQTLSISNDTLYISNGNFVILSGGSSSSLMSVQERLNGGESPQQIYQSNAMLLDSLYGKTYQGGLIAYFNAGDGSGLICTATDLSTTAPWGCSGTLISSANGTAVGTGAANTASIISECATPGIAARLCDDLILGGFSDWFLPSNQEFNQIYLNLHQNGFGAFGASDGYHTSTQFDNSNSYYFNFFYEEVRTYAKTFTGWKTRAVRTF